MSTAKVIVNPYAGRWKARSAVDTIEQVCSDIGFECDLAVTERPGQAAELAREAVKAGYSPVVAAGGDGSINEVLNGVMQAAGGGVAGPMGIIPLGSADDFADMLKLDKDVEQACRVIQRGHTRPIDVGVVNGHCFVNNSAIGLEPVVTLTQARMKRVKGIPRYVLAALRGVLSHHPWYVRISWDGGEYEGLTPLISVGNGPRTGGVFWMTPLARPDDGFLDFIYAGRMSRLKLLALLPSTFKGTHIDRDDVHCERTRRLTIECDPPSPIQTDGEVFDLSATHIEYTIIEHGLHVIVGPPEE